MKSTPKSQRVWRACLVAAAGSTGAAGVLAAAGAAHVTGGGTLATAADFLILHAVAALALVAIAAAEMNSVAETSVPQSSAARTPVSWLAVATLQLIAVAIFSGDLALFSLRGAHLFPMAAPTGGTLLIASWIAIAGLGAWRAVKGDA